MVVDSQIVRRQRVSLSTIAWDILSPDFAAIDIGEVHDRRLLTNHALNCEPAVGTEMPGPL
jgi:hypothetical protein